MRFADLHLHSLFSDGISTPEELVRRAAKQGLAAIAIADHDTVSGIDRAIKAAEAEDIEVLPAIEFSAEYNGLEVHILGYLLDYKNKTLLDKLDSLRQGRIERIYKITDKLKGMGIDLDADDVFKVARGDTVGRLHVARALVEQGLVGSIAEAFYKYIGDGAGAYVCGFRYTPQEIIKLIRSLQGIPVLAHPYTVKQDDLVLKLISDGLMGLEVYYPEHSQAMTNFYLGLAQKYNLLVTGGSDYHGTAKPGVDIGSVKIPYELVERLKEAHEKS